jgi:carboxypeptidase C (cathepsin A)
MTKSGSLFLILFLLFAATCKAQPNTPAVPLKELPTEQLVETNHKIKIGGKEINYKASAGTVLLHNEKDEPTAAVFYVAYTKLDVKDPHTRPVTFCFNGGPGSSSIWLHMGVLGPKRVVLNDPHFNVPPYSLTDNDFSILDVTDLVFIDPVSTGYSREVPGQDAKQFHGVEQDIKSVGEFVRLYITRYNRWGSPKYLMGESYGTTRAAGLVAYLHDQYTLYFNGVLLVSAALNFQTLDPDPGNDLPYIVFLPSYTATAWYHKRLSPDLQADFHKTLREVEQFATGDYALALLAGDRLEPEKRKKVAEQLSKYTSISSDEYDRANLRLCFSKFVKGLLYDQKLTVGRYDGRYVGLDKDTCSNSYAYDPSYEAFAGAFTGAFYEYIRSDLKWEKDTEYKVLTDVSPWDFGAAKNKYLSVTGDLKDTMIKNPSLRVYVANGYYDLATPYFGTIYTFDHLGVDADTKNRVTMSYFDAGHMMYLHLPSLEKFKKEVSDFIRG